MIAHFPRFVFFAALFTATGVMGEEKTGACPGRSRRQAPNVCSCCAFLLPSRRAARRLCCCCAVTAGAHGIRPARERFARRPKGCRGDAETNPRADDVGYLSAIIGAVGREVLADRNRVYAAGTSNGGNMAVRVRIMNGTADPLLPRGGGKVAVDGKRRGSVLSTEESL